FPPYISFFLLTQKTAYEIIWPLDFRRVLFRPSRVSRPSIRGSPSRIWLRTILPSRSNRIVPTSLASGTGCPLAFASSASRVATRSEERRVGKGGGVGAGGCIGEGYVCSRGRER